MQKEFKIARKDIINLCQRFKSPIFVQGAGGNVSVKINYENMYIKASGFRLAEVSENNGISQIDLSALMLGYQALTLKDENLGNLCIEKSHTGGHKPSMETSFHAYLKKYSVHLHPIHMLLFLCSQEGSEIASEISENHNWIPYAKPGHELGIKIRGMTEDIDKKKMVFLANHGIIATSESANSCSKNIEDLEEKTLKYFSQNSDFKPFSYQPLDNYKGGFLNKEGASLEFIKDTSMHHKYLFPDAVVFMNRMFSGKGNIRLTNQGILYSLERKKAESINEIISAHIYLLGTLRKINLNPVFLTRHEIESLDSMPAEKYRREKSGI